MNLNNLVQQAVREGKSDPIILDGSIRLSSLRVSVCVMAKKLNTKISVRTDGAEVWLEVKKNTIMSDPEFREVVNTIDRCNKPNHQVSFEEVSLIYKGMLNVYNRIHEKRKLQVKMQS